MKTIEDIVLDIGPGNLRTYKTYNSAPYSNYYVGEAVYVYYHLKKSYYKGVVKNIFYTGPTKNYGVLLDEKINDQEMVISTTIPLRKHELQEIHANSVHGW